MKIVSRLTKNFENASTFLHNGGVESLLNLDPSVTFATLSIVTNLILRHILEDVATLQSAMETEIINVMTANPKNVPRQFLNTFTPVICRDPDLFLEAAANTCRVSPGIIVITFFEVAKERLTSCLPILPEQEHHQMLPHQHQ